MAKFGRPLQGEIFITQTNHTQSNNTAVDFSAVAETPVYAVADGPVTYRSSGAGSYCIQQLDNSDLKVYYVHTYKWVGANTHVKKGQIICYVAPQSLNGGYPTHLHFGLPVGKSPMDYFDRSIVFRTRYQAIKNIWFIGENLNWAKFQDLSYLSSAFKVGDEIEFTGVQNIRQGSGTKYPVTSSTTVGQRASIIGGPRISDGYAWWDIRSGGTGWVADVGKWRIYTPPPPPPIEPPPPEPSECEKELDILRKEIDALESTTETQAKEIGELKVDKKVLEGEVDKITAELSETRNMLSELEVQYEGLQENYKRVEGEKNEAIKQLAECKENCQSNVIEKIVEWFRRILSNIVGGGS